MAVYLTLPVGSIMDVHLVPLVISVIVLFLEIIVGLAQVIN
jgi:hypothetical protein